MRIQKWILALSAVIVVVPIEAGADSCDAVLEKGIFNTTTVVSDSRVSTDFEAWQCKSDFRTHEEARDAGVGIGVLIYGVPVTASGTFSESIRTTWKSQHCDQQRLRYSAADYRKLIESSVSDKLMSAWVSCKKTRPTTGLRCDLSAVGDAASFFAQYAPNSAADKAPSVQGAIAVTGLSCTGIRDLKTVTFGGNIIACSRKTTSTGGFEAAKIVVNTSKGACTADLPGASAPELVIGPDYAPIDGGVTIIDHPVIRFTPGGRLRVRNGGTVIIRAQRIEAGDAAILDGRGESGAPGGRGRSGAGFNHPEGGPPHTRQSWPAGTDNDYFNANNDCNSNPNHKDRGHPGERGGPGGPGATFLVRARKLNGTLTCLVKGGEGGAGGPGGYGMTHVRPNAAHDTHNCPDGPPGPAGANGADGLCDLPAAGR